MAALAEATLTEIEREAIERIVTALHDRFGDELRAIWLYGSRARGEPPGEHSDVDLLVVTEGGRERDLRTVSHLAYDAAAAVGAEPAYFSTVVMSPERVENRRRIRSFFIQEVDRDKVVLYGEP